MKVYSPYSLLQLDQGPAAIDNGAYRTTHLNTHWSHNSTHHSSHNGTHHSSQNSAHHSSHYTKYITTVDGRVDIKSTQFKPKYTVHITHST